MKTPCTIILFQYSGDNRESYQFNYIYECNDAFCKDRIIIRFIQYKSNEMWNLWIIINNQQQCITIFRSLKDCVNKLLEMYPEYVKLIMN